MFRAALRRAMLILALPFFVCRSTEVFAQSGASFPRQQVVTALKDLEKSLGFKETGNFSSRSDTVEAYYRCYYTGKFEIPASYEELQLAYGNKAGCPIDQEKFDVFFYPIEAVANGKSPVTASLANASLERLLVVVPHEDFHEGDELRKLPPALTEAAATLIGFLTASEFAQKNFGVTSRVSQRLSKEPELFLQKAEIVNAYHQKLSRLYRAVQSGEVAKRDAPALKDRLFTQMQEECKAITPDPSSFNKCLSARNNAGLAFDMTYTKYYPLLYEVFAAQGRELRTTIDTIKRVLAAGSPSEQEAVRAFRDIIATFSSPPLSRMEK